MSMTPMHRERSRGTTARLWAGRGSGGGSRGVGSTSSPQDVQPLVGILRIPLYDRYASGIASLPVYANYLPGLLVVCIMAGSRASQLPPSSSPVIPKKERTSVSPFADALLAELVATCLG